MSEREWLLQVAAQGNEQAARILKYLGWNHE